MAQKQKIYSFREAAVLSYLAQTPDLPKHYRRVLKAVLRGEKIDLSKIHPVRIQTH